jgi:hypothetical protein
MDQRDHRMFGVAEMKSYFLALLALVCCFAFAIGGYAVGAYMQFAHTFAATQGIFARDLITAEGLVKHQESELLESMRTDAPLQYQFLTDFEAIRNAPLPVRLSTVAQMTWSNWSMASGGIRSSDRWRQMMRRCECGLSVPDPNANSVR